MHIGIDTMIGLMPNKLNWTGDMAKEGFCWKEGKDPTGHLTYHVHAGPFAQKITHSLKDIALLLASQDYNLIIDDVAFGADQVNEWKEILKEYDVLYVGIKTPLEILEKREKERGDRCIGSARGQYFTVHENVSYDLEIDTHLRSLEENISIIQKKLDAKDLTCQQERY